MYLYIKFIQLNLEPWLHFLNRPAIMYSKLLFISNTFTYHKIISNLMPWTNRWPVKYELEHIIW